MFNDQPIESHERDLYDRNAFAEMIGDTLLSTPLGETICVALTGPWGSGKTSVVNLIQKYITTKRDTLEPRTSIISFNPWNFTTSEQLISQFFVRLAEFFGVDKKGKNSIGQGIIDYASKFELSFALSALSTAKPETKIGINLLKSTAGYLGGVIKKQAFCNKSMQTQKNELDELLKNSEERLIVVIDDIDRLSDDQIRCIFQLVTVICKFPNIIYLLSFDKKVVAKALDGYQHEKGEEFLDKVIQVPLCMPRMNKEKLNTTLAYHLNELIKIYNIQYVDTNKWSVLSEYCVQHLIKTHRDIVRLRNELDTKLLLLSANINFVDLVALTIIEQHEPELFNWIERNERILTGQITYESIRDYGNEKQDKEKRKKKYQEKLSLILLHKEDFTIELALEILCLLFPQFSSSIGGQYSMYDENDARRFNSMCHPTKFARYFSYAIEKDEISNVDLMFILNDATEGEIKKYIFAKDKQGVSIELFDEMKSHIHLVEKQRIRLLIHCIGTIGDQLKSKTSNGLFYRNAPEEAVRIINTMLLRIDEKDRYSVIYSLIQNIDVSSLNTLSGIVYMLSIAENNKSNSTEGNPYEKYPTLLDGEYSKLENIYLRKVKGIVQSADIYHLLDKRFFMTFYKQFSEGKEYIKTAISSDPVSVLKYVEQTADHWNSSGAVKEIGITDEYKEFVTEEQVDKAIEEVISTDKFDTLDRDIQRVAVAFMLRHEVLHMDWKAIEVGKLDEHIEQLRAERSSKQS